MEAAAGRPRAGPRAMRGDAGRRAGTSAGGGERPAPALGTLQMVGIVFMAVAGGPYGFEEAVAAGGLRLTLVFLAALPLVWSLPLALMTAELSCLMPENGGHVVWIDRAFGQMLGSMNACAAFLTNVFDNALYPVLFVEYANDLLSGADACDGSGADGCDRLSGWPAWAAKVGVLAVAAALNLRGVRAVGDGSVAMTAYVLLPFAVMAALALWATVAGDGEDVAAPAPSLAPPGSGGGGGSGSGGVAWGEFLAIMTWNLSGFDSAGACAGDVSNPSAVYPRAMAISMVLLVVNYGAPTLSASVVLKEDQFSDGAYLYAAGALGGQWLRVWTGTGALVCTFGLLVTLLFTSSNSAYGMARLGHMPRALGKLARGDTPYVSILTNAVLSALVLNMSFELLAQVDMVFYSVSTILKFGALLKLRGEGALARADTAYKVPLDGLPLVLACVPPCTCCAFTVLTAPPPALAASAAALLASAGVYYVRDCCLGQYGKSGDERLGSAMGLLRADGTGVRSVTENAGRAYEPLDQEEGAS